MARYVTSGWHGSWRDVRGASAATSWHRTLLLYRDTCHESRNQKPAQVIVVVVVAVLVVILVVVAAVARARSRSELVEVSQCSTCTQYSECN